MEARREVEWVAKLALLEGYRERDAMGWGDPRLKAVDIQWSDVRADRDDWLVHVDTQLDGDGVPVVGLRQRRTPLGAELPTAAAVPAAGARVRR